MSNEANKRTQRPIHSRWLYRIFGFGNGDMEGGFTVLPAKRFASDLFKGAMPMHSSLLRALGEKDLEAAAPPEQRRRDVCAAVWSLLIGTMKLSALDAKEKRATLSELRRQASRRWRKHFSSDEDLQHYMTETTKNFLPLFNHRELDESSLAQGVLKGLLQRLQLTGGEPVEQMYLHALLPHLMGSIRADVENIKNIKKSWVVR